VHRIEGGDEVKPAGLAEVSGVAYVKARVRKAFAPGLQAGRGDPGVGKVKAGEPRTREGPGHQVDGVAGPAPDVGDVDARPEPAGRAPPP